MGDPLRRRRAGHRRAGVPPARPAPPPFVGAPPPARGGGSRPAGRAPPQPAGLVFCWGPLGHGYEVRTASQHLLLVAGGIGVAPLVWLADEAGAPGTSATPG